MIAPCSSRGVLLAPRAAGDRGVFVLLDRSTPTRLLSAFPAGVEVKRLGLADVAAETKSFLTPETRHSA
jgi:ATP-dependent DNA helicase DinG